MKIPFPNLLHRAIAALCGVMLLTALAATAAIVQNGDFEADSFFPSAGAPLNAPLTGWSVANSPATGPAVTQVIGEDTTGLGLAPHGGSIAVTFSSNASAPANTMATISQTLTTVTGQAYNLQLWVANPTSDPNARLNLFSVSWAGAPVDLTNPSVIGYSNFATPNPTNPFPAELAGNLGTYVVAGNTGWFEVDIPVVASGTSSVLTISGQNNNDATLVDDVSVTPEPSSAVLFAVGAALMGARRRRRQRAT